MTYFLENHPLLCTFPCLSCDFVCVLSKGDYIVLKKGEGSWWFPLKQPLGATDLRRCPMMQLCSTSRVLWSLAAFLTQQWQALPSRHLCLQGDKGSLRPRAKPIDVYTAASQFPRPGASGCMTKRVRTEGRLPLEREWRFGPAGSACARGTGGAWKCVCVCAVMMRSQPRFHTSNTVKMHYCLQYIYIYIYTLPVKIFEQ